MTLRGEVKAVVKVSVPRRNRIAPDLAPFALYGGLASFVAHVVT